MHFKQLESFVYVIRHGSFSKAADKMYLAQSTISIHINTLEERLGCQLIVRTPKGVFPSEAGKAFYKYALQMLRLKECAEDTVRQYKKTTSGNLLIAASTVPASYILPKILAEFIKDYPDINLTMTVNGSLQVSKLVENMEIEVGITGYNNLNTTCNFQALCKDRLVIITPNTPEYICLNGVMTKEFLKNAAYVVREADSGTQKQSYAFLNSIGIDTANIKTSIQVQDTQSVVHTVMHGAGIAIVSPIAVLDKIENGKLLSFDYENNLLDRQFYVTTHKYVPLTPLAELFVNFLFEYFRIKR